MRKSNKELTIMVLGAALLAAAWMIGGPSILSGFNWPAKAVDILTFVPSVMVTIWLVSGNKNFMACEYRAWRRIFRR